MPISNPHLWSVIRDWSLPSKIETDWTPPAPRLLRLSFEEKLQRNGNWTDQSAIRITAIYRQFLYLKAVSGAPISPSKAIDIAWHQHLEFASDYAALCEAIGQDIPHLTDLDETERKAAYTRGRELWRQEFDNDPPDDLWPSLELLKSQNIGLNMMIAGGAIAVIGLVGCATHRAFVFLLLLGAVICMVGAFVRGPTLPEKKGLVSDCA